MSGKDTVIESVAIIAATGTAASTAVGVTALARGESAGRRACPRRCRGSDSP